MTEQHRTRKLFPDQWQTPTAVLRYIDFALTSTSSPMESGQAKPDTAGVGDVVYGLGLHS